MNLYKDFPKESGIYCYENKINNKKYVGSAVNIYNRVRQHETNFSKETYDETQCGENVPLWNSVKKHGRENFISYVVELCEKEFLDERETYHIRNLKSHITENGFNILWGGFTRLGTKHTPEAIAKFSKSLKGLKRTDEVKKKMSESKMGHKMSEESRLKMIASKTGKNVGKDNPNFGRTGILSKLFGIPMKDEVKEKISKANKGKIKSEETKEKLRKVKGEKHWAFGKKLNDEEKDKLSKQMLGVKKAGSSSEYKGVSYYKNINRYKASITINRVYTYIGVFKLEIDAAKAYDEKCWEVYQDLSMLNFPENYK